MTSSRARSLNGLLGWLGVLCLAAGIWLFARQYASPPGADTTAAPMVAGAADPLPFDPDVRRGTLDNGLRYLVRANAYPANRAELRLVVNAGSVLEADDQRGLAHFVEHMAFNGTRRFPRQAIGEFMESIGMRFGPGVNATTGFEETVYRLQVPTDRPAVIDRALMILEDWAHQVEFDAGEIDLERPVVLEEWRARRGAGARAHDAQWPVLVKGSPYVDRLPIGTPESLKSFDPARLRQFYRDWYRPDLMTVVAVGDFDADAMTARVRDRFAGVPARPDAPARPAPRVPAHPGTEFVVVADPEVTAASVSVTHRRAPSGSSTLGDYRRDLVERLAVAMLSTRFAEIAQTSGGPFLRASVSRASPVRGLDSLSLAAAVPPDGVVRGLTALAAERQRLARHGFTAEELDRQRLVVSRALQRAIAQANTRPSATLAAEYVRHVTVGEPVPGLAWEAGTTPQLLPGVTLGDVNRAALGWLTDDNRVIAVITRDVPDRPAPSSAALQSALDAGARASVSPWVPRPMATDLMDDLPAPGDITAESSDGALGITEWTLANGAVVVLMPTTFKEDEIVFRAVAPGGLSLADDRDLVAAQTSAQVVSAMGFGRLASGDLRRALTGRVVSVQPGIGAYDHGISGSSSRQDLEAAFQLVHLMMTAPRRDPAIFEAMRKQMRTGLANQDASPDVAFAQALAAAMSQEHPRSRPLTLDSLDAMDVDRSLAFYRSRFGGATGFTFVFAGSVEVDLMRPLVERYLASIPALPAQEGWRDRGVRPPSRTVVREVRRGVEDRSRTAMIFTAPFERGGNRELAVAVAAEVFQSRLRDLLREELGGTYTVGARGSTTRIPAPMATISVEFTSDPGRADALARRVLDEAARLARSGPDAGQLGDARAARLRDFETNQRQNGYLVAQLAQRYLWGGAAGDIWDLPRRVEALTAADVRDAARAVLGQGRHIRVTLRPQ